jgi:hypothetical protein
VLPLTRSTLDTSNVQCLAEMAPEALRVPDEYVHLAITHAKPSTQVVEELVRSFAAALEHANNARTRSGDARRVEARRVPGHGILSRSEGANFVRSRERWGSAPNDLLPFGHGGSGSIP